MITGELINDPKARRGLNYPKICCVCNQRHIRKIADEMTDGMHSWHRNCDGAEQIPIPTVEKHIVVTDKSLNIELPKESLDGNE